MTDGFDATEITPGLAIAAAELFHEGKPEELESIASMVDAELFSASSIQLILMVIDWIALSEMGDQIAQAYETDNKEALDALHRKGARFEISEDGTLSSWVETPSETAFDFPLEFWTQLKFAVQAHADEAASLTGISSKVINSLTAGIINDGIIRLLAGENEVAIPSAAKFFNGDKSKADYAVVVANAFITASVIQEAAKSRTYAIRLSIPDSEPVVYEDVANVIRDSLREELLES